MRKLKTYQQGDPWRGTEQPLIRFGGRWLREAGFEPGDCYQLVVHAPGCLTLTRAETGGEGAALPGRVRSPTIQSTDCSSA